MNASAVGILMLVVSVAVVSTDFVAKLIIERFSPPNKSTHAFDREWDKQFGHIINPKKGKR